MADHLGELIRTNIFYAFEHRKRKEEPRSRKETKAVEGSRVRFSSSGDFTHEDKDQVICACTLGWVFPTWQCICTLLRKVAPPVTDCSPDQRPVNLNRKVMDCSLERNAKECATISVGVIYREMWKGCFGKARPQESTSVVGLAGGEAHHHKQEKRG